MRKIEQPLIQEIICDVTGDKKIEGDFGSLELPVLVADKDDIKESKSEGFSEDLCYEGRYLELDINPQITYEIVKYLLRKYPQLKEKLHLGNMKIAPWIE